MLKLKSSALLKSTILISTLTLISRIFGYIRDLVIASEIGAGLINDAFIAAFRITNMFRNVFAEGALNAAFVPIFTKTLQEKGKKEAIQLAAKVQSLLLIALFLISIIIIIFMPFVIRITAPGFSNHTYLFTLAVEFGRLTFPYLFFISLCAFYGCVLNSIGKFFSYAATPIFLNILIILFALPLHFLTTKGHSISFAVLIAGVIELLWMLYFLYKNTYIIPIIKPKFTKEIKNLLHKMLPAVIGSGVTHINTWVSMIILSFIPAGLSYIYYADRIMQLPLAIIGTAIGTVLLPVLTRNFEANNKTEAIKIQNKALDFVLFFTIPASFAFFYLSNDMIYILLERGKFKAFDTLQTAQALSMLGIGLPAFTMIKVLQTNFFSQGDTKTPVIVSVVCIIFNVLISIILLEKFQHIGIAIANSFSGWCNIIILITIAYKKHTFKFNKVLFYKVLKYTFSSTIMINLCIMIQYVMQIQNRFVLFLAQVICGVVVYFILCFLLRTGIKFNLEALRKLRYK